MEKILRFNSETHKYEVDGICVPSVTEILRHTIIPEFPFQKPDKVDLGTKVHLTTEYYDKGILERENLHPALENYLQGWVKFLDDYKAKMECVEQIFYHKLYKYAGTVDRIAEINGELWLIDIKTGKEYVWHSIQTEGYAELLKDNKIKVKKRACVYLSIDGNYKVNVHTKDENIFLACLSIYNYKKINNLIKSNN